MESSLVLDDTFRDANSPMDIISNGSGGAEGAQR